jgi:hypothetical protein
MTGYREFEEFLNGDPDLRALALGALRWGPGETRV